jgi:hypothetical protein
MKSVFINIGEYFVDGSIEVFKAALQQTMEVESFSYAVEKIEEINNRIPLMDIYYLETNNCFKNKNYTQAYCNLINNLTTSPNAIYLLPYAPARLVKVIKQHWPETELYVFDYLNLKPSKRI